MKRALKFVAALPFLPVVLLGWIIFNGMELAWELVYGKRP